MCTDIPAPRSRDGGETWSTPSELIRGDKGGRGPVKNKPIVLNDGTWAAPASLEGAMGHVKKQWRAFIDFSKDQGRTWRPGPAVLPADGGGVIQPTVWESKPGHLHMLMRSSRGQGTSSIIHIHTRRHQHFNVRRAA